MKNLLSLILERLDYERLIEEGKDPVEALHTKYDNTVPSEIIDKVISVDPTKKKSYSQWLLSHWNDQNDVIEDNLDNGRIEKLFQYFHERNDIQLKALNDVEKALDAYVPPEDTVLSKGNGEVTYVMNLDQKVPSEVANDFDILFNEDDWIIATPNTYEASCKLGENMTWCTANAYGNGEHHYNNYLERGGKYYINFDLTTPQTKEGKDYPYTRYQFHFETKQFMDAYNHPVKLDEIGMPDSAVEYYNSIGYDIEDYLNSSDDDEWDEDAEREDYESWRSNYRYDLGDELYLNIGYDFDFNHENVNEHTRFYIFDEYDDIDPITNEDITNPYAHDDTVLYNNENGYVKILRCRGVDDRVVIVNKSGIGRYRQWGAETIRSNYFMLPDDTGVIGINPQGYLAYYSDNNTEGIDWFDARECSKMFVNEPCSYADEDYYYDIYVEAVIGKYHSLFGISSDSLYSLIYKDIPQNGEYFEIDENGIINGLFQKYRILGDGNEDKEEDGFYYFDFEEELDNGCYLISHIKSDNYRKYKEYNIFDPRAKKLVLEKWYENFDGVKCGAYVFHSRDGVFVLGKSGKSLGSYRSIDDFDRRGFIIGRKDGKEMLINTQKEEIICDFSHVRATANDKLAALCSDGYTTIFYDYIREKRCFEELGNVLPISNDDYYKYLYAVIKDGEETYGRSHKSLFDFGKEAIVIEDFIDLRPAGRGAENNFLIVKKHDGEKENLFETFKGVELLPNDADKIIRKVRGFNLVEYLQNGKNFIYDYGRNKLLTNPNGFSQTICLNYTPPLNHVNNLNIAFSNPEGGLHLLFVYDHDSGHFRLTQWSDGNKIGMHVEEITSEDLINMYCDITGNQPPTQQRELPPQETDKQGFNWESLEEPANAVAESIKKIMKRIDEISNVRWNDIIN